MPEPAAERRHPIDYVTLDPGLPRAKPTDSYWQHDPHRLAQHQSCSLPATTDVAVIGSGITALGLTSSLLQEHPSIKVTLLEARNLCSGATGRNGGQLAISVAENYASLRASWGPDMAGKIAQFTMRTMHRVKDMVRQYHVEEAQLCELRKLRVFLDIEEFENVKRGLELLKADQPSLRDLYQILDSETCVKEHGVFGAVGAIILPAATLWPYRMVTNIFEALLVRYPTRFLIETNTPVLSVAHDSAADVEYPYVLHTPRGQLRASQIAYCINGYAGHLLPSLCGHIFPYKGTMTVQDLGEDVPDRSRSTSWAVHYPSKIDARDHTVADGLTYLAQNSRSGYFFFGGDKSTLEDIFSADDDKLSDTSVTFLKKQLRSLFGLPASHPGHLISAWSGVMGFTADHLPLVGQLPHALTGREGMREWIAGGYNGYGMVNALLCGEVLGQMMLGKELPEWFPNAYLLDQGRLDGSLKVEQSADMVRSYLNATPS